ncbi:hypothetical protein [Microbacterium sp. MMO-113]|uniref:hypothetical protein n=1 Tax=Microbacterium sp. MMO-113 TaxID=3081273 RepID=UPI0030191592
MDITQTADLLAEVQLIDNRRIEEATLVAWHRLVDDLDYSEAVEAVRLHFRTSTTYLTPAHVRAAVERIRLAGLGPQQDEYGNDIEPDYPAVAAYERLHPEQKAITS